MILPQSIERVREAAKVEEVLGEFINLRRAGVNMKANCPFHDEKTPSFVVSPAKGIYKCFGCGKAGDSIRFLMDHSGLGYVDAIRWLADKYNIELEETEVSEEAKAQIQKRDSYFIINQFAQETFHKFMMESNEGRTVGLANFKERGFLEKTISKWGLGYAPEDRTYLYELLKKKQYNIEYAHELGLLKNNRDFFASRIIFPVRNIGGKIIAFGARTLKKEKHIPKYLNSPESEIYFKSKSLFGFFFAKSAMRKLDRCYMVEGYTDVISLSQNGIENVVASSGTSLTQQQVKMVQRFTPNITMIYDGDKAGIKAALRGLDIILEQDMNVRLLLLPEGEDPDSYIKRVGVERFKSYIEEHEKDFIRFKIEMLLDDITDPAERSQVMNDIIQSISKIADPLKRNEYIKLGSRLLDVDESIIQGQSNKNIKERFRKAQKEQNRPTFATESQWKEEARELPEDDMVKINVDNDEHQERDIIRILMRYGDKIIKGENEGEDMTTAEYLFQNLYMILDTFHNQLYADILASIAVYYEEKKIMDSNFFLHHEDENIRQLAIELNTDKYTYANWSSRGIELQTQSMPDENYSKDALQAILRLKTRKLQRILEANEHKIIEHSKQASADLSSLIEAFMALKQDLKEMLDFQGMVVIRRK